MRAFLSHSSKDKNQYVRSVAEWLGKDNIHYDEWTFEEGGEPLIEILSGLDRTDIFVLFLSSNALDSDWVKREIIEAKNRLDFSLIDKIFPIIIEDGLTYQDERIPEWLKNNYNVKPIKRPHVAAKRIHNKLREISWSRHPELKKRQEIFVGRNDKQEEFEARIHDFEKRKPTTIIASGFPGVGRRTFLHKALIKANISTSPHRPSAIVLDRNVSIEDFIFKLNDLGLVDLENEILNLTEKSVKHKSGIVHRVMKAAYDSSEIIFLVDEGCIVNYKREISTWFSDIINNYSESSYPIFCLASKYRVNITSRPRSDKYYFLELNELNANERSRFFGQLAELYKLSLDKRSFDDVCSLLHGFPDQVMFAVDILREDNQTNVIDKLPLITSYSYDKAAALLSKYEGKEDVLDFIRLLAQFEVISADFVFSIVGENQYYSLLEELASENIIELIGLDGEIIRLNDIIRDFIKRNRFKLNERYTKSIKQQVELIANSDDVFERDSSEFIFTIKEALKTGGQIDERFLIPSHYLRCMKDLYYTKGNLERIIELADIILQKKESLEPGVLLDIRYYLCLALAKKKNTRMLKEVQAIKGDEHSFLLGYFYRLQGRYSEALEQFNKIIDAPYVASRAKREVVQVYVQLEEYDKALGFAKRNYEENRSNQFHTQAYFHCLINSEAPEANRTQLQSLIDSLRFIDSEQSREMADIAEALFNAKITNDRQAAFDKINDCIATYPGNHYPILTYCDIALKYLDKESLGDGLARLNQVSRDKDLSTRTVNKYRAFQKALEGDMVSALNIVHSDISRYPNESRNRLIARLEAVAGTKR
ncbi:TIR domain-containing protein [Pseudomonas viridiflava]|uniref:TIR domain-containing protein n=1 Tax=Pseudomonas viridiflava TaxID=33069 RepID=A0ABU7N826_PSEVI|nr:toll/interleukin-1 receptor domain-containing protein [Pseudomonas viridiflava]MEE3935452.1 TIR domain-containing protein [Pseudomonas viridiflava]MEE4040499.1 TIR domain-containing protein [Pseudomonas viridiflava]MEE4060849.1 TIR domain-containing protein [Pseudomonas viridiflava]MEE4170426.1 TIR domain-containing protein [Pseudomonas viridiflava]